MVELENNKQVYIFDTSVLVHDSRFYQNFKNCIIIIPIEVILELDKLKTFSDEAGKNARSIIRFFEEISTNGNVEKGVIIDNGSEIKIKTINFNLEEMKPSNDRKILRYLNLFNSPILVSRDLNLRLQARSMNKKSEGYESFGLKNYDEIYSGFVEVNDTELSKKLKEEEWVDAPKELKLNENQFVVLNGVIGRKQKDKLKIVKNRKPWGLELKNKEQLMAADLICDAHIPLVSLIGMAGCGKSLISLACALDLVLEKKTYQKLIIYRPIQSVGKELGALPGTLEEKLDPYLEPIRDNLDFLFNQKIRGKNVKGLTISPQYSDRIEMQAISYIRGRSIQNSLILLDEAQNLDKFEIKTILTRAGKDTKIIVTADLDQIDNKNLDSINNGISYLIEKFKMSELAGHITLQKGMRSELATLASEIL